MCRKILLGCLFLVMCFAIYVSNTFGHMRGVSDADKRTMRNISRAVLIYHEELGQFLEPIAHEQARELTRRFGVAQRVDIREIEHTSAKGFVFASVTRNGKVHDETIMFGNGTVWYLSSESAPDLP